MTRRARGVRVWALARATGIDDLFGHVPQAGELALPRDEAESDCTSHLLVKPPHTGHTKDTIRVGLNNILSFARAADAMPWDAYYLRYYSGMFVYMAEWLKDGEGDALMAEFKAELDRLGAPDDQVAPNWRRVWGIAA